MPETYSEWLRKQPTERQEASLSHMRTCHEYGKVVRAKGHFDPETQKLLELIKGYYRRHPDA